MSELKAERPKKKKYEDWEIRSALEDLERAEKVKENPCWILRDFQRIRLLRESQ